MVKLNDIEAPAIDDKTAEFTNLSQNLNTIVSNLTQQKESASKTLDTAYTLGEESLIKQDYFLSLKNNDLNQQLNQLENIQSIIATRDALIKSNERQIHWKEIVIHIQILFFVVMAFLVFPLVAYWNGSIGLLSFISITILTLGIYCVYAAWKMNTWYIRSWGQSTLKSASGAVNQASKAIQKEGQNIQKEINSWVHGNCQCEEEEEEEEEEEGGGGTGFLPIVGGVTVNDNNGFFYYDGTAPQQRIIPPGEENIQTQWEVAPDMGSRTNSRFTPPPTWMPRSLGLPKGSTYSEEEGGSCSNGQVSALDDQGRVYLTNTCKT